MRRDKLVGSAQKKKERVGSLSVSHARGRISNVHKADL